LVLIAQAVFLLPRRHTQTDRPTHKITDATDQPNPRIGYAGVE